VTTLEVALVIALAVLVLLAALLAVAEVSLLRTHRVSVDVDAEQGNRRAQVFLRLLDQLPLVLNTILLAVLFIQVSAAAITGYLAQQWLGGVAITIATMALTIVLFVYSEAIPKTLALRDPRRSALFVARPVAWLVRLGRPLTALLLKAADAQTPGTGATAQTAFSEAELRMLADESADAGQIDRRDADLVHRSFEFGDVRIADVMVPKESVVAARDTMNPNEALDIAVAAGHRRLPVYRGGLDDIIGIVRLRELAAAVSSGEPSTVAELARKPLRVAGDSAVAPVLAAMQTSGLRFAVVTDLDGATEGIVTIEDIVAELVGEIEDPD